jgi:hypothetical protein
MDVFGFTLPLWAVFLGGIIIVVVAWKLIKFALKVLLVKSLGRLIPIYQSVVRLNSSLYYQALYCLSPKSRSKISYLTLSFYTSISKNYSIKTAFVWALYHM